MPTPDVFPQWKGFERSPEGLLLRQVVDLDTAMGIAYERSVGFFKEMHTHARLMIVAPRGACRMDVTTPDPASHTPASHTVDARGVLLVPAGLLHDDRGVSAVYDTMALYPSDALVAEMVAECVLGPDAVAALSTRVLAVARSVWLDEILERYFSERVLGSRAPAGSQQLLEKQILHEVARVLFDPDAPVARDAAASAGDGHDALLRAVTFIEGNLFEPLDVPRVCTAARTSESSLLRAFKRALGQSPAAYVRGRRLDEAARLLGAGDHQVGDVALLIGYDDIGAFTRAFKQRFGVPPRDYLKR